MQTEIQESYSGFKQQFDEELKKSAEGFVRIGFLLKVARDTNILQESGYKSESEFAKAEYGLSKDQVSRFIRINDRFSVDGYSDQLAEPYAAYGVSKLAEMLTLPDKLIEAMSPDMSKAQIQDVRREVREEEKITDIEVMLEEKEAEADSLLEQVMRKYFEDHREILIGLKEAGGDTKKMAEILAPAGTNAIMVRISGRGKIAWIIKSESEPIELVDVRRDEKETYTWQDMADVIKKLEVPEENEKVAPVQQEDVPEKEEIEEQNNDIIPENGKDTVEQETTETECTSTFLNEKIGGLQEKNESEPETMNPPELNREMLGCARNAFQNLKFRMEHKAYRAALTDARDLVHYLEAAGVENDEENNEEK